MGEIILESPANYTSVIGEIYSTKPGLRPLGTDFGNGEQDKRVFQIDNQFFEYHEEKKSVRKKGIEKYFLEKDIPPETRLAVNNFFLKTLPSEYPDIFMLSREEEHFFLINTLTKDKLSFSADGRYVPCYSFENTYASDFDALAFQIQEDFAVIQLTEDRDYLAAGHVCLPSHWALEEKIGKSFLQIHKPVEGMDLSQSYRIARAIATKGPFVRFVVGIDDSPRLSRPKKSSNVQNSLNFNSDNPEIFVRIERQVTIPLPEENAAIFFIRPYVLDARLKGSSLAKMIRSMTPEQRIYKSLGNGLEIANYLEQNSF